MMEEPLEKDRPRNAAAPTFEETFGGSRHLAADLPNVAFDLFKSLPYLVKLNRLPKDRLPLIYSPRTWIGLGGA